MTSSESFIQWGSKLNQTGRIPLKPIYLFMFVLSSKGYFLAEFGQMTDVSFASIALWLYIKFLTYEDCVALSIEHSHRCEYGGHFQLEMSP